MILVVSSWGLAAPLARRMHRDGEEVLLYMPDPYPRAQRMYDGLCPQAQTWAEAMDAIRTPGSVVFFDFTGNGAMADHLALSYPVWGDSRLADEIENDRGEFMRICASCGIRIPKTIMFHPTRGTHTLMTGDGPFWSIRGHVKEAVAIARTLHGKWMVKPYSGSKGMTHKADTIDGLCDHLQDMPHHPGGDGPFILQQCIDGPEVATEVWWSHGEPIPCTANGTIETKRFIPGDMGPNTGSETSLLWPYGAVEPRLFRETMGCGAFRAWMRGPVFNGIRYAPFNGPMDFNTIISREDHLPYTIEPTPRPGWSSYIALAEFLEDGQLGTVIRAAAHGHLSGLPTRAPYGYCVKLSVPPYPVSGEFDTAARLGTFYDQLMSLCRGVEIEGPTESPHVWLQDARMTNGVLEVAGVDGSVADIGGAGRTVEEARDSAHALFDQLVVANKQGRTIDGADRAIRDLGLLQSWGYETPDTP